LRYSRIEFISHHFLLDAFAGCRLNKTSLSKRVAIVTGAGSGIGEAIARRLASSGASVAIVDVNIDQAKRVSGSLNSLGQTSHPVYADVSKDGDVRNAIASIIAEFGSVHVLVNNAGIGYTGRGTFDPASVLIENYPESDWNKKMDVNLKSMFLCCKYVAPHMKRQRWGKIVSISSRTGRRGQEVGGKGGPAYGVSKAGMINLTKTVARQLGPYNINVNCIAPDAIEGTGFVMSEEEKKEDVKHIPIGRLGRPEDVAALVEFLCSDDASFVHGATIDLDGGSGMW
jgi:3-oxoacyl-[acyl-carrier protein] reductase